MAPGAGVGRDRGDRGHRRGLCRVPGAVEVDSVTVTFIVEASDDDFDAFLLLADEVLRTVAFP